MDENETRQNSENPAGTPASGTAFPAGTPDLDCRTVSWLRFPLIAMVVLIHVTLFYWCSPEFAPWFSDFAGWVSEIENFPVSLFVIQLLQGVVTCLAIPMFLFVAGYFYFYKIDDFTFSVWRDKNKRRVFSLLIPYLVWNLLAALQIYVLWLSKTDGGGLPEFLRWAVEFRNGDTIHYVGENHPFGGLVFMVTTGVFCQGELFPRPLFEQFWFVRDLFFLSLISPIWWWILKHKRTGIPVLIFLLATVAVWSEKSSMLVANAQNFIFEILFFGLGAFFSVRKLSVSAVFVPARWLTLPLYLALAFLDLGWEHFGFAETFLNWHHAVHVFGILAGAAALWGWVARGIVAGTLVPHKFLAGAAFFVFCSQIVGCRIFEATILRLLPKDNEFEVLLGIFFFAVFILAFSVSVFKILRSYAPATLIFLSGGRGCVRPPFPRKSP